ncbi:MAG TPA: T9SS type A sorting domain-containing protein [Chitinophagaceae bacterium]|nr:T9SS type A sorting domain-containing protein [Chitinophagaceae bacterium]
MNIHKFLPGIFLGIASLLTGDASAQWKELGSGSAALKANGVIGGMTIDATSNIYVGGHFTNTAGKKYVAKWNGSNWTELGSLAADGDINALTKDKSGNIYAGGGFKNSTGKRYVAKWDGSVWSEIGSGTSGLNAVNDILCLATDAAGTVYAAGKFTNSGPLNSYVAKWDGSAWTELGGSGATSLKANAMIQTITTDKGGNVYAAGAFTNASGRYYVAKWNGSVWSELGALNANAQIYALTSDTSGNLYAAGDFTNLAGMRYVAKWNGTSWTELGTGLPASNVISSIAVSVTGKVYVGGFYKTSTYDAFVSEWNGSSWSTIGTGADQLKTNGGHINALAFSPTGFLYATGTMVNSAAEPYVAKYAKGMSASEPGIAGPEVIFSPNPFVSQATISLHTNGADANLSILNALGQSVWYKTLEKTPGRMKADLDLNALPSGNYWLKVQTADGQTVQQIIKAE